MTAQLRRSWSPRATANSQPIPGFSPWYAPSNPSESHGQRSATEGSREGFPCPPAPSPVREGGGDGGRCATRTPRCQNRQNAKTALSLHRNGEGVGGPCG